ncbi:MAG: helix-turn-helix transcriptional regulator [Clostridiales bacterium]|nr:helix-turn-helix transcriptional regulator [Clostridiales bacterium]
MQNSFGSFLKQKRQEKNLTQKNLASMLFVSESAVSKWEKDVARPDIILIPKLSKILEVTEHELITASIDKNAREEKKQAKNWRTFSIGYDMFFYIIYTLALVTCFICNLAIDKTLSWFYVVLSALILAFTFTNLPKLIKRHRLVLLPLSMFLALCLLLGVCAIQTSGDWFLLSTLAVLFVLIVIFIPIYIAKYKVFEKIKKYNDFISVFIDFIMLNVLLIVIDFYTVINFYAVNHWYFNIALPITLCVFLLLNVFLCVRFLKTNKFIKTSVILFLINALYMLPSFIKVKNIKLQNEIDSLNIFKANFSYWQAEITLENNVHLIIFLTILLLALVFLLVGVILHRKKFKQNKNS